MTPKVSVVIPTYNRAHTLGRALKSVLAQTFQDFEIVVVDDGSNDDPKSVCESFGDPRIHYLRQDNRGGGAARNAGIDAARGRFVAFLDSDDEFLPDHLKRMHQLLSASDDTVGYARVVVDRGNGRSLLKPPRTIASSEHMATYLLCDRGFVPTITLALPREIAARVRYSEGLKFAQDTDFAIRLFLDGCCFAMIEAPGAIWHDLPDPNRTSANRRGVTAIGWLEAMRPLIPARAYRGGRGWMVAKGIAPKHPLKALGLYLNAMLHGCYRPRLALIIGLQIFLSDSLYRRIADQGVAIVGASQRRDSELAAMAASLNEHPC